MENLNAEQIKSDLAICVLGDCQACHYNKFIAGCRDELCGDALALINSQEQRIKELMSTSSLQGAIVGGLRTTANELTADKERLEKLLDDKCDRCIERERADTVSEIRARVAVHFGTYCEKDQVKIADVFKLIDQIAKEMLEGDNEN